MTRPFHLVDVFGTGPLTGNPLAVIADAEGLSGEEMQAIAGWLNFSETTFLLAPTDPAADYRVRIFTMAHELPFAGHPTLGSVHAWLAAGGRRKQEGTIVQQCGVGLVTIRQGGDSLAFAAPPLLRGGTPTEAEIAEVATLLRIDRAAIVDAAWADNGPGWIAVLLESADAVLAVEPARHHPEHIDIGIVGPHAPGAESAFELRAFFTDAHGGLIEDPVTGSLNASVGQWLFASGRVSGSYIAAQGTRLGRTGRIHVSQDASGQVWVAGTTRTLFTGRMQR
ncbi:MULTISPECIES: PhzF family phenazine biosynthesis protein [unclassified Sphingomonas]|uniref:PhzF family phenazine biosynthesis protein n=1 Tax=unclassified Sphingomonas TaxID=196159 RepID=UPI0006F51BCC|nr:MULTISPECIES: PhzF family phenazine biosynthesis protein [unclassified Sphingomonas]KQN03837.1 phenazine biosynthesis protein PhzF [Sphingomonas sp. Leaf25]